MDVNANFCNKINKEHSSSGRVIPNLVKNVIETNAIDLEKKRKEEEEEQALVRRQTIENDRKKRLDYLLKQMEIFSHFMNKNTHATKSQHSSEVSPKSSTVRRREVTQNDADDTVQQKKLFQFHQSPSYINGEMRDYQIRGLNWMISLYENGINGILADEMGLGKTLQTVSMIGYLRHFENVNGPHLIIAPKSTVINWLNEFKRFCSSVKAFVLIGDASERKKMIKNTMQSMKWDVCITSYEICQIESLAFRRHKWRYVVIDEAHRIKNEKTKLAKVVRKFEAANRLLLTGTPLHNNLHELWALLNFMLPDVFNNSDDFDTWFDSDDCLDGNHDVVSRLHNILKPFMLRRIKSEVEKALLPKKETKIYVGLTKLQREVYTKVLLKDIEMINSYGNVAKKQIHNILAHLRKAANHPYLMDGIEPGPPYTTDEHLINSCGKMMILDKLLTKLKSQGSRVLIFSQFVIMLDILEDFLVWRGHKYSRLDGNTEYEDRVRDMDEFNDENSSTFVYLISTRAGGLGINLIGADTVIIYDSDWNPQIDLQAIDRAHRIGQKKQVRVFRLITENTVDEKIVKRANLKLRLDSLVIQQGRPIDVNANAMSKGDQMDIIRFGAEYVLSSTESDIIDMDIEKYLERGEIKTAEENRELDKLGESALRKLKFDMPSATRRNTVYNFEGTDFRTMHKTNENSIVELPKRSRKPFLYFSNPSSVQEYLKKYFFQFYPMRLNQLLDDEIQCGLTNEENQLKEKLLKEGFPQWSRNDFENFVDAIVRFGPTDDGNLFKSVVGKTELEVSKYNAVFWQQMPKLNGFKDISKLNFSSQSQRKEYFDRVLRNFRNENATVNSEQAIANAVKMPKATATSTTTSTSDPYSIYEFLNQNIPGESAGCLNYDTTVLSKPANLTLEDSETISISSIESDSEASSWSDSDKDESEDDDENDAKRYKPDGIDKLPKLTKSMNNSVFLKSTMESAERYSNQSKLKIAIDKCSMPKEYPPCVSKFNDSMKCVYPIKHVKPAKKPFTGETSSQIAAHFLGRKQ